MATILHPFAPWMRDLSRFMNTPGAAGAFLPPADVLVSEDGVMVYAIEAAMSDGVLTLRLPQPARTQPRRIQIHPRTAVGNGAGGMQTEAAGGPGDSAPTAGNMPEGAPGEAQSQTAPSGAAT